MSTHTSKHKKMSYIILALVALTIFQISANNAAPSPPQPPSKASQEYLQAHNKARAEVGVPPLKWSIPLATSTSKLVRYQRDKMYCNFANLTSGKFGGNQLVARGMVVTPSMAVNSWVKEKQYYNHANNSCLANHMCGVYTQVVWKNSLEIGCAQAVCVKDQTSLTICFYNPPGNVIGESPF